MDNTNDLQLTAEEQAAEDAFAQRVRQDPNLASISDERLVQFMMARKFEQDRAYELLLNSMTLAALPTPPTSPLHPLRSNIN